MDAKSVVQIGRVEFMKFGTKRSLNMQISYWFRWQIEFWRKRKKKKLNFPSEMWLDSGWKILSSAQIAFQICSKRKRIRNLNTKIEDEKCCSLHLPDDFAILPRYEPCENRSHVSTEMGSQRFVHLQSTWSYCEADPNMLKMNPKIPLEWIRRGRRRKQIVRRSAIICGLKRNDG